MSKDGSVAPRERINIQYKSEKGGPAESVELPFKVLVTGDFTLRQDDRMVEERKPISVDKNNFNEVLRNQNVTLDMTVARSEERRVGKCEDLGGRRIMKQNNVS